jgi:hypothetical protein
VTAVAAAVAVSVAVSIPGGGVSHLSGASALRMSWVGARALNGVGLYHLPAGAAGAQPGSATAARSILLTAASKVAGTTPPPGARYYVHSSVVGNFVTVGPARRPYLILEKVADQDWTALGAHMRSPSLTRALSVQAASAGDEAAWRRDGSPTTWNVDQNTSVADPQGLASGFDRNITAGRGPLDGLMVSISASGKTFGFGGKAYSAQGLQKLPADPARLKAMILSAYYPEANDGGPGRALPGAG